MKHLEYTVDENDNRYYIEIAEDRVVLGYAGGDMIAMWENGDGADILITKTGDLNRADLCISYEDFTDNILTAVYSGDFCEFFWNMPVRELKVSGNDADVREIMRMEVRDIYDIS